MSNTNRATHLGLGQNNNSSNNNSATIQTISHHQHGSSGQAGGGSGTIPAATGQQQGPRRATMDLDHEPRERLNRALAMLGNHQLLMKYALDTRQVSFLDLAVNGRGGGVGVDVVADGCVCVVSSLFRRRGCIGRRLLLLSLGDGVVVGAGLGAVLC